MPLTKAVTLVPASFWPGACSLSIADSSGPSTRGGGWSALPPVLSAETDTPGYFNRGALVCRFITQIAGRNTQLSQKWRLWLTASVQATGYRFLEWKSGGCAQVCCPILLQSTVAPCEANNENQLGKGSWAGRYHRCLRCGQTVQME